MTSLFLAQTFNELSKQSPFTPPNNWLQGRTLYGGFSTALALQVAQNYACEELPPLNSVQVSFIGPVTADILFQAQMLRRGKSATQLSVDAIINNATVMRANFIFASPRQSIIEHNYIDMPVVDKPEKYDPPPLDMPRAEFFNNFDVRFVSKAIPMSNANTPELIAWVRLKHSDNISPEIALLMLGDSLPPASMACFKEQAPISSMTWSINFPQPAISSEWFLLRSKSLVAGNGYSYQIMEAWSEKGELALVSTQTVAIFT